MPDPVKEQEAAYDDIYQDRSEKPCIHDSKEPLVRFLRDRRVLHALRMCAKLNNGSLNDLTALVLCGGDGGEASIILDYGIKNVTNTDLSKEAARHALIRDPRMTSVAANAEAVELPDESFDIVLVQDGLHHLPRPVLGLNEMIRLSRKFVIVIEPAVSLIGNLWGTKWEVQNEAVNYVFRWNRKLLTQVTLSQILQRPCDIQTKRIWDHGAKVHAIIRKLGLGERMVLAKGIYALLAPFGFIGNNFIGVIHKKDPA